MSGLAKDYKSDYSCSNDSLYSGETVLDQEYTEDYFDNIHYISEKSKILKVAELAKTYNVSQRKLTWKIDFHVVPPFALIYFIAYLNRSSFGILQIEGLYPSLSLSKLQFFSSYVAFFAPYIVFQSFSNVLLKFMKPCVWISIGVLFYGATTFSTGFVKGYATFVLCQFFHGLFQAGTDSALFYILGHYYDKRESQRRFSGIYSASCVAGVFATLIAYVVDQYLADDSSNMGLETWRWLLIIEGAITMGTSIVLFFLIPDFPETATFLTKSESSYLIKKLQLYHGESGYNIPLEFKNFFTTITDPIIWLPAVASMGLSYITMAYALFEPVFMLEIVAGGTTQTNKMSIFPWMTAFVWCNVCSIISDKCQNRFGFLVLNIVLTIAGGGMAYSNITTTAPTADNLKFVGCFLLVAGAYTTMPILICWSSTNLGGHLRKSVGISLQVSCGSIGGLIALWGFYDDNFRYTRGFILGFVGAVLCLLISTIYLVIIRIHNKRKRTNQYKKQFYAKLEDLQIIAGDKNPALDYLY